ncbi:hypothetical protein AB0F13_19830 [Streptomyces sp. NPDC026206]|uniref:hypothetical protein n=1 Tax=Streptomyces sp. NPDC026206 TaxID=3157089 RepID=UPI0034010F3F
MCLAERCRRSAQCSALGTTPRDEFGAAHFHGTGFEIRAGHPAAGRCSAAVVADLADAVGELYSSEAEDAVLVWNRVPVRLTYRYDLAVMLDDLVPLLEEVLRPEFSGTEVFWGSEGPDAATPNTAVRSGRPGGNHAGVIALRAEGPAGRRFAGHLRNLGDALRSPGKS